MRPVRFYFTLSILYSKMLSINITCGRAWIMNIL
jgi:hypothetical protein